MLDTWLWTARELAPRVDPDFSRSLEEDLVHLHAGGQGTPLMTMRPYLVFTDRRVEASYLREHNRRQRWVTALGLVGTMLAVPLLAAALVITILIPAAAQTVLTGCEDISAFKAADGATCEASA